ncbi:MAG: pirin family protein [Gammaproteobacteria bacterium]|nr:pirin family protein [Gammaproteobacteria bacterium]NVK87842.1 pirin family protein [Gammaproteobacteria bacterium]
MAKLLSAKARDLGGFTVRRLLPQAECKMVGPFVFFDHMGPTTFPAGTGINVRPHPHIGLATMTYLFSGAILHRDSLGSIQEIFPGDVNWMTAGKGIVHSERETIETRGQSHTLDGLQCWLALPEDKTHIEPSFTHVPKAELPYIHREKILMRLVAGDAYGRSSPVKTYSAMFYLDVIAEQGAKLERPCGSQETAVYLQMGSILIGETQYSAGDFVVLDATDSELIVQKNARFILLGGEKFDRQPYLYWNFLAYDKSTIEQAKERWQQGLFATIPGDDEEFIALTD